MKPEKQPPEPESPLDFEAALARLELIVEMLEDGATPLAEGLARYEEGVGLLKQCYGLLERAERRVELLTGIDSAGQPLTRPLDDAAAGLETKAKTRSQRRSRAAEVEADDELPGGAGRSVADETGPSLFD